MKKGKGRVCVWREEKEKGGEVEGGRARGKVKVLRVNTVSNVLTKLLITFKMINLLS